MTANGLAQIGVYFAILLAAAWPLGEYMARVYQMRTTPLDRLLGPMERALYRLFGVHPTSEMTWRTYAVAVLVFSAIATAWLYVIQRAQSLLPLNPDGMAPVSAGSSFNTAISFVTNTNWQGYGGETMSHFTQMAGLAVQNFLSAAVGLAVLAALIRGLARRESGTIGNFWVDLTRGTLYVLLPLSVALAIGLVALGVPQNFSASQPAQLVEAATVGEGGPVTEQMIPGGPVASQIAIKELGTNGGGFFNVNSAHPFENPTPFSNLLEMLAILLIPAACCFMFGRMVGDPRQGRAVLIAMTVVLVSFVLGTYAAEGAGNPRLAALGVDATSGQAQPGGNMEGKELRFGIAPSAQWAAFTTAASNGSVNSMHDSCTPLGGLATLLLMQFGETIFGGVGSGLYGMLAFVVVAVFVAGLMVGRTPEYLGKKIGAYEVKMAGLVILIMPLIVLGFTALAISTEVGRATIYNPGAHGFSEVLYAYTSQGNNNGSAFAGLGENNPFYNLTGGMAMWAARFWLAVPVLALAGAMASKKLVPAGPGTLPTHTPLFIALLVGVVVIVGVLTFIPALALGPIVEHLELWSGM